MATSLKGRQSDANYAVLNQESAASVVSQVTELTAVDIPFAIQHDPRL
jgi:hypothetical protein